MARGCLGLLSGVAQQLRQTRGTGPQGTAGKRRAKACRRCCLSRVEYSEVSISVACGCAGDGVATPRARAVHADHKDGHCAGGGVQARQHQAVPRLQDPLPAHAAHGAVRPCLQFEASGTPAVLSTPIAREAHAPCVLCASPRWYVSIGCAWAGQRHADAHRCTDLGCLCLCRPSSRTYKTVFKAVRPNVAMH